VQIYSHLHKLEQIHTKNKPKTPHKGKDVNKLEQTYAGTNLKQTPHTRY